jgi:hypothetical protein
MSQIGQYFAGNPALGAVDFIQGNTGGPVPPNFANTIFLVGSGNINVAGNAGTSTVTLVGTTNHAVQVGNAGGSLTSLGVGTDGQVLIGATGADPAFATITSSDNSVLFTPGPNSLDMVVSSSAGVSTITGNTGGAISPTAGNINIVTANSNIIFAGAVSTETLDFGLTSNVLLGSVGSITTGTSNTALGKLALASDTSGDSNTAIGYQSMVSSTTGSQCAALGAWSMFNAAIGADNNTAIGYSALYNLDTGDNNIALGTSAGANLTTTDSNNILIGSGGVVGDNSLIRIGTNGTHTATFIAGIDGVNVGSVAKVVTLASDQLGTATITGGAGIVVTPGANTITISSSGITPSNYTNVNTSPYVVLVTDEYLSVDSSGGAITVQLPNAAVLSQVFIIKDRTGSAAANNITVTTVGGAVNIDGATSFVMNTAYQSIQVIGNGSTYEIF